MILFITQYLYFYIFDSFLSIRSLFNSSDLICFSDSIFKALLSNWHVILIYILIVVLVENGYKNIEELQVGHYVYAIDLNTNERVLRPIVRKFEITVNGEKIVATPHT